MVSRAGVRSADAAPYAVGYAAKVGCEQPTFATNPPYRSYRY